MKIIFDSEEQKRDFLLHLTKDYCPTKFDIDVDGCAYYARRGNCRECWENSIETEVEDE